MDYEVFVPIQPEQYHKIWSFLTSEYQTFDKVFGIQSANVSRNKRSSTFSINSTLTRDLSTAKNYKCAIGFTYKGDIDCGERNYIHVLCRWISLQVGRKNKCPIFDSYLSYYIYDGKDVLYIIPKQISDASRNLQKHDNVRIVTTTRTGMPNPMELPVFYNKKAQQRWAEKVNEEVNRLSRAWKIYENTFDKFRETSALRS